VYSSIANAVQNSRQTILILTPKYFQNEFKVFEYMVKQIEMVKQKHHIIVILLENVSNERSKTDQMLKHQSVTFLEYPGNGDEGKINKFWKRLQLLLPKKRFVSIHL